MPTDLKTKTAQGFFWGALNNGAMQVLNAVFGIVLARKLDQADYGLIGMLTIFTLIANSLQDSGFVTALTNKRNATHHDYNAVFWFNISVSLFLYDPTLGTFGIAVTGEAQTPFCTVTDRAGEVEAKGIGYHGDRLPARIGYCGHCNGI